VSVDDAAVDAVDVDVDDAVSSDRRVITTTEQTKKLQSSMAALLGGLRELEETSQEGVEE